MNLPLPNFFHRHLISFDKTPIHFIESIHPDAKNTLLVLHGASEHAGRYKELAAFFYSRNINCVLMDLRGFGSSGGKKAFWPDFNTVVTDVSMVAADILKRGDSVHLLGHSMGGLLIKSRYV